jgi:hypothetical protein
MKITKLDLARILSGFGTDFTIGRNCDTITETAQGYRVANPRTAGTMSVQSGSPCAFDLLITPLGCAHVEREAVAEPVESAEDPSPQCGVCGKRFKNTQGLNGHARSKSCSATNRRDTK